MSYLNTPHLVFSGDFISDVSTVNNDPQHYNNATFEPSYQEPGQGASNGWWNPEGGATFDFQKCFVKQCELEDGSTISKAVDDPIVGAVITGSNQRNTGKMVDLDPQWQMSSQLWGVRLQIRSKDGELLLEGGIKTTGFRDLQRRQTAGARSNGQPLGGTWTSVLHNIVWGDAAKNSNFLKKLKAKTSGNKLSINLNAYGYYYNHADGRFSLGRVLGCIGPYFEHEPKTFAACRRLYGILNLVNDNGPIFFNYSNFVFDAAHARVTVDFGASFPVKNAMGTVDYSGELYLAIAKTPCNASPSSTQNILTQDQITLIGTVPFEQGDWLDKTSGIVSLQNVPADLTSNQLLLLKTNSSNQYVILARESIDGLYLRADNMVCRLDTDQTDTVKLYAYQYGVPITNASVAISMQAPTPITPKEDNTPPICDVPGNNYPANGIAYSQNISTNSQGLAETQLTGGRIDYPRVYMDGQIYFFSYNFVSLQNDSAAYSLDQIIAHLRSYFVLREYPTWGDIADTMTQFANLYPIMSKLLFNLADPKLLVENKKIMEFALTRDIHDPIYMPVTRDLSENKRLTILNWLNNPDMSVDKTPTPTETALQDSLVDDSSTSAQFPEFPQLLKKATQAKNGKMVDTNEYPDLHAF